MIRLRLFAVVSRYFISLILNIGRDQRGTGSDAMIGLLELSSVPNHTAMRSSVCIDPLDGSTAKKLSGIKISQSSFA